MEEEKPTPTIALVLTREQAQQLAGALSHYWLSVEDRSNRQKIRQTIETIQQDLSEQAKQPALHPDDVQGIQYLQLLNKYLSRKQADRESYSERADPERMSAVDASWWLNAHNIPFYSDIESHLWRLGIGMYARFAKK